MYLRLKHKNYFITMKKIHKRNEFRPIFDKTWMIFLTSQKIVHPVKKHQKWTTSFFSKTKNFSGSWKNQLFELTENHMKRPIDSSHLGTMSFKGERETDRTLLLIVVYVHSIFVSKCRDKNTFSFWWRKWHRQHSK